MCGLSLIVHLHKQSGCQCLLNIEKVDEQRLNLIKNRGPSSFSAKVVNLQEVDLIFHASVLHLRGSNVVSQPLSSSDRENILLWNGEVFGGLPVADEQNDTEELMQILNRCNSEKEISNVFSCIQGPWAFVYFCRDKQQIWFGRDVIGRRSLLWHEGSVIDSDCHIMKISSIAKPTETWSSIPAAGIFCFNLKQSTKVISFYPWSDRTFGSNPSSFIPFQVCLGHIINSSVCKFTGSIEVQNEYSEFVKLCKELLGKSPSEVFSKILEHKVFRQNVETFLNVLQASVKCRVTNHSFSCCNCDHNPDCKHSKIAVLFSGGLDCTVLAILADKYLPPNESIDLINVTFEHKVSSQNGKKFKHKDVQMTFESPDRLSAIQSYQELRRLCPCRQWHLVEVNVTKSELIGYRGDRVQALVFPHQTVLDDSIGCALWFAARGQGWLANSAGDRQLYVSPSKIVLLGMGADEQLAGYSRHRNRFQKDGWKGLSEEIQLEMDRISERNLARDDRIISDSGREARFPYLDENVVNFLNCLPVCMKANFSLPRGLGEKVLLRSAAYKLGLEFASLLPKRAIQFGSRIAHLEEKTEKGSDVCSRLQNSQPRTTLA